MQAHKEHRRQQVLSKEARVAHGITKSMGGLANPEPANAAHGQKDSHRKDEVATPRVLTFLLSGG